jgi:uncharacterized protein YprB with RNaseH-like and TPR domain
LPRSERILVIDIETMANLAWVWGNWQQNIYPKQIVKHKRTICFAAKWVGGRKTYFFSEFHHGHEEMTKAAWRLLNEADMVVSYNGKRFDIKHLNTEFKLLGLEPPAHFQHVDLLQVTKREFSFGSNKLEAVAQRLGIGRKEEHEGFGLWLKCEAGNKSAWKRMRAYNRKDVLLTEELFLEYQPWITSRGPNSAKRIRDLLGKA